MQYSCELSFEPSRKASALSQRPFSSDFMLFCDIYVFLLNNTYCYKKCYTVHFFINYIRNVIISYYKNSSIHETFKPH